MDPSEGLEDLDDFKAILSQITQKKLADKVQIKPLPAIFQEMMEFVQELAGRLEKSDISPPVACSSKCSYCCYSHIKVIPVEALLIFSFIEQHFTASDIRDLKGRIHNNDLLMKGKSSKERVAIKDRTPCIFLKNNQCSIYPARPLICRSWHSFDKTECERAFIAGNHTAKIETFAVREYMFNTAREVFQEISDQMDVENGVYEMPAAILSCFMLSRPLENWRKGNPVFDPDI